MKRGVSLGALLLWGLALGLGTVGCGQGEGTTMNACTTSDCESDVLPCALLSDDQVAYAIGPLSGPGYQQVDPGLVGVSGNGSFYNDGPGVGCVWTGVGQYPNQIYVRVDPSLAAFESMKRSNGGGNGIQPIANLGEDAFLDDPLTPDLYVKTSKGVLWVDVVSEGGEVDATIEQTLARDALARLLPPVLATPA